MSDEKSEARQLRNTLGFSVGTVVAMLHPRERGGEAQETPWGVSWWTWTQMEREAEYGAKKLASMGGVEVVRAALLEGERRLRAIGVSPRKLGADYRRDDYSVADPAVREALSGLREWADEWARERGTHAA